MKMIMVRMLTRISEEGGTKSYKGPLREALKRNLKQQKPMATLKQDKNVCWICVREENIKQSLQLRTYSKNITRTMRIY